MFGKKKPKVLEQKLAEEGDMTSSSTFFSSSDRTISVNPLAIVESPSSSSSSSFRSSSSDCGSAAHSLEDCGIPQFELPQLFPYHHPAEVGVGTSSVHNNTTANESSCGSSQESGWDVQPHFDFPQLFPYHTGFISVNGGRAATSTIPSEAGSGATTVTASLGASLEPILEDLHQQEWTRRRHRPKRRLSAAKPPVRYQSLAAAAQELKTLRQEIRTTTTTRHDRTSPGFLAHLHHRVVQLALQLDRSNVEVAKESLQAWKRILEKSNQAKHQIFDSSTSSGQDWLELGHFQNDLGWYNQAMESYEEALKRHQYGDGEFERARCYICMGRTLLNQQKPEEAFRLLNQGHKILRRIDGAQIPPRHNEWDGQILYMLARADLELGPPLDEALLRLQASCRVLKARKDWAYLLEIYLTTGRVYAQCQDYEKADEWYEDALQIVREQIPHQEQENFQSHVARLYLAKGDVLGESIVYSLQAVACYQKALSICQANPNMDAETSNEALVALADMYCNQGDLNEALSYYQQANTTEASALHRHIQLKRGLLLYRMGDFTLASQDLQDFCSKLEYDEDNFTPLLTLAICLYILGTNHALAKRFYKEAMAQSREVGLEAHVQKVLAKTWSKLNRARLKKVLGRWRGASGNVLPDRVKLDVVRE